MNRRDERLKGACVQGRYHDKTDSLRLKIHIKDIKTDAVSLLLLNPNNHGGRFATDIVCLPVD